MAGGLAGVDVGVEEGALVEGDVVGVLTVPADVVTVVSGGGVVTVVSDGVVVVVISEPGVVVGDEGVVVGGWVGGGNRSSRVTGGHVLAARAGSVGAPNTTKAVMSMRDATSAAPSLPVMGMQATQHARGWEPSDVALRW